MTSCLQHSASVFYKTVTVVVFIFLLTDHPFRSYGQKPKTKRSSSGKVKKQKTGRLQGRKGTELEHTFRCVIGWIQTGAVIVFIPPTFLRTETR